MNRFLLFIVLLLSFSSCTKQYNSVVPDLVYQSGDDLHWASPSYDDRNWAKERSNIQDGIYWARTNVKLPEGVGKKGHIGIMVHSFGAFEVYWDGVLIGNNGQIKQQGQQEIPGTETSSFIIPDTLAAKGNHLVAIRASQAFMSHDLRTVWVVIDAYDQLIKSPLIVASFMNLTGGVFLIAALYHFFIFIHSRRKDYAVLIFCITCFLFFILQLTEYIKFYINIPYAQFYLRLEIIGFLTFLIALLIPLYFCIQFEFKKKRWLLGILMFALLYIYGTKYGQYDYTAWYLSHIMWLAAVLVVGNAVFRRKRGAVVVMAGLLISALIDCFLYYDYSLFICFNVIILCMLYLHAIKTRDAENEYSSALLLSARLKAELLKKNIQPHFIKNTLTSLIDWIEESPKEGVVFIQALSAEFDLLNEMAEERLIPIEKEIELCKVHLKVMQFRKEVAYQWSDTGIDPKEMIPPAIIHTILENGITHSKPLPDGSIRFHLSFIKEQEFKRYTLSTVAENREVKPRKEGGTGFRYIKARLRESYGDDWTFTSEMTEEGWMTIIKIYKQK